MPPKRRKRSTQSSSNTVSDSPSSESEHDRTMDIINRLSKKYLGSKPGNASGTRRSPRRECDYDGDAENTTESQSSMSDSPSPYEFDEMDVSPEPVVSNKLKSRRSKHNKDVHKTSKENLNKLTTKSKSSPPNQKISPLSENDTKKMEVKSQNKSKADSVIKTKSPVLQVLKQQNTSSSKKSSQKRKLDSDPEEKPLKLRKSARLSQSSCMELSETSKGDSAVFVSPLMPRKFPIKLPAKDTSTPSNESRGPMSRRDSCFGFSNVQSPLPMVSPVRNLDTPMSDYASMDSLDQSMLEENERKPAPSQLQDRSMFSLESESDELTEVNKSSQKIYKPSKIRKKYKKGRHSVSKVDAWASQVNDQFDEIEKFELSIEG